MLPLLLPNIFISVLRRLGRRSVSTSSTISREPRHVLLRPCPFFAFLHARDLRLGHFTEMAGYIISEESTRGRDSRVVHTRPRIVRARPRRLGMRVRASSLFSNQAVVPRSTAVCDTVQSLYLPIAATNLACLLWK